MASTQWKNEKDELSKAALISILRSAQNDCFHIKGLESTERTSHARATLMMYRISQYNQLLMSNNSRHK